MQIILTTFVTVLWYRLFSLRTAAKFIYVYLLSSLEIVFFFFKQLKTEDSILQFHLFRVTLRAIDGDENICVCSCP